MLAAVAALAAVPLLFTNSPASQTPPQAKAPDKSHPLDTGVVPPAGPSQEKKPAHSSSPSPVTQPAAKAEPTKTNPPAISPDPKASDRRPKPDVKPQPAVPPKPPSNPPPSEKHDPPAAPTEIAKVVALDGLLAAVDAPPPRDTAATVSLGKLAGHPRSGSAGKTDLDIQLLGGDTIAKGNPTFSLRKEDSGKEWPIVMGEKNNDGTAIARVFLDGGECKFQWTSDARDRASLLRFCGLQFSSGNAKHVTLLTSPKPVAPLLIDLDAAVNRLPRRFLSREFALPDASLLRLQILPLDPSMPRHEMKVVEKGRPGHAVRGRLPEMAAGDTVPHRGHALIILSKERTPPVTFQIGFDVPRKGRGARY